MAHQLSNMPSDGTVYGQNVTDKIAFFGATAVVRPSISATASSSALAAGAVLAVLSALGPAGLGLITLT